MKKNNVVIIGRPNAGKSTLFNKIVGGRKAITSKISGTTRDIISEDTSWQGVNFTISDSGGLDTKIDSELDQAIQSQTDIFLQNADIILFLVNIKEGITQKDQKIAKKLKLLDKKIVLVVNKCDNEKLREQVAEFYKLGLGKPLPISAISGIGAGDLLDKITNLLQKHPTKNEEVYEKGIKISILGKPNVGKSSLFNALCGENKVIVSREAGTTRDLVNTTIHYKKNKIILTDTAGLRRKVKIKSTIEKYSSKLSLNKIAKSDICLLVLGADEKTSRQDLRIASQILKSNKSIILIINKWDKIKQGMSPDEEKEAREKFKSYIKYDFNALDWAPIIFISAKNKENINAILEAILEIKSYKDIKIDKKSLKSVLTQSISTFFKEGTRKGKKIPKFNKFVQSSISNNNFNLYTKNKRIVPNSFINSLKKRVRKQYIFLGTPININLKTD